MNAMKSPKRILLVEDYADSAEMLKEILQEVGHLVTWVDCGAAALHEVAKDQFDVVVLDLGLPDMSGHEVGHGLKALRPSISLVLMSAGSLAKIRTTAAAIGALSFFRKPFSVSCLKQAIDSI